MKTIFKKNGGFTLVELIVVIAILAILAAVAIPAYSGYIEKANKAGDEQLLNSLNKAFTSACTLNGADPNTLAITPQIIWADADNDGVKRAVAGVKNVNSSIASDFLTIFAGNENTEFKVIKNVRYIGNMFVDAAEVQGTFYYTTEKGTYVLDGAGLQAIQNSVYGELGSETLLDMVDGATGSLEGLLKTNPVTLLIKDPAFIENAATALGITVSNGEELFAYVTKLAEEAAGENASPEQIAAETNRIVSSAVVLHTAKTTDSYDKATVQSWLTDFSNDGMIPITSNMTVGTKQANEEAIAQAAVVYAMYAAYKNDGGTYDAGDVINALGNDAGFKTYLTSAEAQNDLDGYLAAMGMLNASVGTEGENSEAVKDMMINGFASDELKDVFGSALGN